MANELAALCGRHGVRHQVVKERFGTMYPGMISVLIDDERTRLSVGIDFEQDSIQPNVFVLNWHFSGSDHAFIVNKLLFHDYNPFHFMKATDVVHGWDNLKRLMNTRLEQIAAGEAAIPAPAECDQLTTSTRPLPNADSQPEQ
jgi:hypothetical protein